MSAAAGLWDLVVRRAESTPDALFAVDERDRTLSFVRYRNAALRCAAALAARGVGEGTAVSWILPTRLEALVLAAALARLGARQNPILPIYREREVGFVVAQSKARLLVVPGPWRGFDYPAMARAVADRVEGCEVLVIEDGPPEADPAALPEPPGAPAGEPPIRWLFYTSGTTADPKGALHTDAGLIAASDGMCDALGLAADDRIAMVFPVTHVGGVAWLVAALRSGGALIAVESFDPKASIDVLARHGVTQGTAGTVFHQAYLAAQRERGSEPIFPRVRAFPGGGAPKPPELHHAVKRELGGAGIVSGWGMTECPIVTMNRVGDDDVPLAHSEGRPTPGMQVRSVGPDGSVRPPGAEGELRVRGPQVCRGYLDSSLDADAFDAEGWLRTGDLGRIDAAGYVTISGRLKDVIIRKGENISAKEVEDLLHRHPGVAEAAVIGLPDAETGERCCAVVACREAGAPLALDELTGFLREQGLAPQKLPERLELVAALPRNPTGKVLKRELRERYAVS